MHMIFALSTAFTLWMMVDAVQKGLCARWGWIIMIPFGEFAYFFAVKIYDFSPGGAGPARLVQSGGGFSLWRSAPPSIDDLRYRFEQSPSLDNQMWLAQSLYDSGEYAEAAQHLEEVVRRDEDDVDAHYGLARTCLRLDRFDDAEAAFRDVIRLQASYGEYVAWRDLAELLQDRGRSDEAADLLRKLTRVSPRLEHCLALARMLYEREQYREASEQLKSALLDFEHAPRHVQRMASGHAQAARQLLAQIT
jgi:tetratricopeptide (TPR) repeat protein